MRADEIMSMTQIGTVPKHPPAPTQKGPHSTSTVIAQRKQDVGKGAGE